MWTYEFVGPKRASSRARESRAYRAWSSQHIIPGIVSDHSVHELAIGENQQI